MSWYSTDISGLRMQKQMSDREMRLKERESQLRNDPGHIFMSALMQAIPNSAASALGSVAVDAAKWNWFGGQEEAGSKIMARDWTIAKEGSADHRQAFNKKHGFATFPYEQVDLIQPKPGARTQGMQVKSYSGTPQVGTQQAPGGLPPQKAGPPSVPMVEDPAPPTTIGSKDFRGKVAPGDVASIGVLEKDYALFKSEEDAMRQQEKAASRENLAKLPRRHRQALETVLDTPLPDSGIKELDTPTGPGVVYGKTGEKYRKLNLEEAKRFKAWQANKKQEEAAFEAELEATPAFTPEQMRKGAAEFEKEYPGEPPLPLPSTAAKQQPQKGAAAKQQAQKRAAAPRPLTYMEQALKEKYGTATPAPGQRFSVDAAAINKRAGALATEGRKQLAGYQKTVDKAFSGLAKTEFASSPEARAARRERLANTLATQMMRLPAQEREKAYAYTMSMMDAILPTDELIAFEQAVVSSPNGFGLREYSVKGERITKNYLINPPSYKDIGKEARVAQRNADNALKKHEAAVRMHGKGSARAQETWKLHQAHQQQAINLANKSNGHATITSASGKPRVLVEPKVTATEEATRRIIEIANESGPLVAAYTVINETSQNPQKDRAGLDAVVNQAKTTEERNAVAGAWLNERLRVTGGVKAPYDYKKEPIFGKLGDNKDVLAKNSSFSDMKEPLQRKTLSILEQHGEGHLKALTPELFKVTLTNAMSEAVASE